MNIEQMTLQGIKDYVGTLDQTELLMLVPLLAGDGRKSVQQLAGVLTRKLVAEAKERARLEAMWQYERASHARGYRLIAGTDEVGRGPLAGPVVAAAVILPEGAQLPLVNDSKKLKPEQRERLFDLIQEQAIAFAIAEVDHLTIDRINILRASQLAMVQSVENLATGAEFVLVDGLDNAMMTLPHQAIVKGDSKSISIAAASILAKVHRDRLMEAYDGMYPGYGFAQHKGYPTAEHYQALQKLGACPIHRRSFRLFKEES